MNDRRTHRTCRCGTATVEFAVALPILVLIVIGSIESSSMLFLRQALVQASYEGAKVASKPGADNLQVQTVISNVTAGRGLTDVVVTTDPVDVSAVAAGQWVRVTVSAPGDSNSFLPFGPFQNRTVSATTVMAKE